MPFDYGGAVGVGAVVQMPDNKTLLFICEKYYLRFYRPLAARLVQSGFRPVWVRLDGPDEWDYDYVDPTAAIDALVEAPDLKCREGVDDLYVFERAVFERPNLFENSYPYTMHDEPPGSDHRGFEARAAYRRWTHRRRRSFQSRRCAATGHSAGTARAACSGCASE